MDSRLKTLTELQLMVSGLEADLGISEMSEIERKALLSLSDVYSQVGVAATGAILSHPMLSTFSRPSLFRALKALEAAGKVTKVTEKQGYYAPSA
jgi:hypothetical protein